MKTKGGPLENTHEYPDHVFKDNFKPNPFSFSFPGNPPLFLLCVSHFVNYFSIYRSYLHLTMWKACGNPCNVREILSHTLQLHLFKRYCIIKRVNCVSIQVTVLGSPSKEGRYFHGKTVVGKDQNWDLNAFPVLVSFIFKITKQTLCSPSDGAGDLDWLFCTSLS